MVSIPRSEGRALYRSGVGRVPCRPPFPLGVVPSQRLAERRECTSRSASSGLGRGVFASPRLGPKRLQGRPRIVFCLGRHSGYHPRFITPGKDTSSTPSRASAPASGARRAVRAPVGDASAPFRWLTGSTDAGGSRRSLVGTSRLVPQCHGWRRSSRRMRSLGRLVRAFGGGPPPHAMAQHRPARPPCTARPTRRAPSRSQVVRWSWPCAAAQSRALCRLRAGRVARVEHAETARVRRWAAPHRPTTPGRRVACRTDRRR